MTDAEIAAFPAHLPRTMRIATLTYEVIVTAHEYYLNGNELSGMVDYTTQRLWVSNMLTAEKQELTLLHEALHAVSVLYDIGLSESQIGKLELGLAQFLRDNILPLTNA